MDGRADEEENPDEPERFDWVADGRVEEERLDVPAEARLEVPEDIRLDAPVEARFDVPARFADPEPYLLLARLSDTVVDLFLLLLYWLI